MENKIENI